MIPFSIYGDWNAHSDAPEAKISAREVEARTHGIERRVDELERRLERTTLVAQALWELLHATGNWSEAALLARIESIDLRDGKADGRITRSVIVCPACGRNSNSRRRHCIYCEGPLPDAAIFDAR